MDDPNIGDINLQLLLQLEAILENKSTRENFLQFVPTEYFDSTSLQLMENASFKFHMTTARWLLLHLSTKGACLSELMAWFERAHLEKALVLFKKDVPLRIIRQPPPLVHVQNGGMLSFYCEASSFPFPEFRWFKEDEELLLQHGPELVIEHAQESDAGTYCCLVTKNELDTNCLSYIYTKPVEVVVLKEEFYQNHRSIANLISHSERSSDPHTGDSMTSVSDNLSECPLISAKIEFVKNPIIGDKIPQGASVTLKCKAKCTSSDSLELPVKYQWFKDGRPLTGATSRKLSLEDLEPDSDGIKQWQYCCRAFNCYDSVFSKCVKLELENVTDETPFTASEKYALIFANDSYSNIPHLKTPAADAADVSKKLQDMNFKVFPYLNLTLTEMRNALEFFLKHVESKCYVVFFFAGHAFQQNGQMYLLPVDCSEEYGPREAVCLELILKCLQKRKPALNILLLDACRNLPPLTNENSRQIPCIEARMEHNTFFGYATPGFCSARERGSDRNSFFVKSLLKSLSKKLKFSDIWIKIQRDISGDVQFPEMRTTVSGNQTLHDAIERSSDSPSFLATKLKQIRGGLTPVKFCFSPFTIIIETMPHMDVFINDLDIVVSISIDETVSLQNFPDVCLNLISTMEEVQFVDSTGIRLSEVGLKHNHNNVVLKKHAIGIQKLKKNQTVECVLLLQFLQLGEAGNCLKKLSLNVESITHLELSLNHLEGSLLEEEDSS